MNAERVLVVIDEMEVGGSQRQVVHLLRGLASRGRQVSLLYFRTPSFLLDGLEEAGVVVRRIPKKGRFDPVFVWRLARFLRAGRFDLVHCYSITAEVWVRLVIPVAPRTRFVCSVRGLSRELSPLAWRAKCWAMRRAQATISNSAVAAEAVARRCGLPPSRIDVVPNGLPGTRAAPASRREARARLGLGATQSVLLFVGRLVGEKNIPGLLRALAAIAPGRRPMLLLAGEGPERPRIEEQVTTLGLGDCVRLLGERRDVDVLMAAADGLVLPSLEEGLSNVILEAMAAGLPVIASQVGGNVELIEPGRSGLLFDPASTASIAEAIERLFDDGELRDQFSAAGRDRVGREFSLDAMVARTVAIHDRCMGVA